MHVSHFLHLLLAALLLGTTWCDALFLRAPASLIFQPRELIAAWRTRAAILEMVLLLIVVCVGVGMWAPRMHAYPSGIFHGKVGFAVVALVIGKVRMLKERKSKSPERGLTWALAIAVTTVFCLGAYYAVGGR